MYIHHMQTVWNCTATITVLLGNCIEDLRPSPPITAHPTCGSANSGGGDWKLGPGIAAVELEGWFMEAICCRVGCCCTCWAAWNLLISSRAYCNTTVHRVAKSTNRPLTGWYQCVTCCLCQCHGFVMHYEVTMSCDDVIVSQWWCHSDTMMLQWWRHKSIMYYCCLAEVYAQRKQEKQWWMMPWVISISTWSQDIEQWK